MTDSTGSFPSFIELDKRRGDDESLSGVEIFAMRKNQKSLHDSFNLMHTSIENMNMILLNHSAQIGALEETITQVKVILEERRDKQGFVNTVRQFSAYVGKPIIWLSTISGLAYTVMQFIKLIKGSQ